MTSAAAFVFTALMWLNDGQLQQPPIVTTWPTLARCERQVEKFDIAMLIMNAGLPPWFQMTWHRDCRAVFNDSAAHPARF